MHRRSVVDGILPSLSAAILIAGIFWIPSTIHSQTPLTVVGLALTSITGAVMIVHHSFPTASTVIAAIATVVGTGLGVCEDPMLATAWCLYPLAIAHAARTRTLVLMFVCFLAALAAVVSVPGSGSSVIGQRLVLSVAALSVAWLLGTAVGKQITSAREAERARVQLEVARDVHDEVGHALAVISAEAGVTRGLADADERELRDTLADIERHARAALEEVQGLVRGLRSTHPSHLGEGASGRTAGSADLRSLVATTRAAGVDVVAAIEMSEKVDGVVRNVVFRIIQESLSNVVRHASGATCTVDVQEQDSAVVVRVRDHGPGTCTTGDSGFGLRGMRERARLIGGGVTWGNHPEGGFMVEARVPTGGS